MRWQPYLQGMAVMREPWSMLARAWREEEEGVFFLNLSVGFLPPFELILKVGDLRTFFFFFRSELGSSWRPEEGG